MNFKYSFDWLFDLIMPIMQLVLYGYLSNEVLYQGMIVWDQSKTAESRELIRAFETTRYFQVSHYAVLGQQIGYGSAWQARGS